MYNQDVPEGFSGDHTSVPENVREYDQGRITLHGPEKENQKQEEEDAEW